MDTTDLGPMGVFEGYGDYDTPEPVPATNQAGEVEDERKADAWNEFFDAYLTDGNDGYSAASVVQRCREAFEATWPKGWEAAFAAAYAALATQPATSQEGEPFSREWCLNMAALEGNAEIGAGSLDHPLRLAATPTPPTLSGDLREAVRVAAAIKATEYKYFGDYEMSDGQREAVNTLVEVARNRLRASQPCVWEVLQAARSHLEYLDGRYPTKQAPAIIARIDTLPQPSFAATLSEPWVPKIGDPIKVSANCEYSSDWERTELWVAGLAVDEHCRGINVTVTEQWPVPIRFLSGYIGHTDGFLVARTDGKRDDLEPRAARAQGQAS